MLATIANSLCPEEGKFLKRGQTNLLTLYQSSWSMGLQQRKVGIQRFKD